MNKIKFNPKNKFRYFIICNGFMALMFDGNGQGYWIAKNNKNASINHEQTMLSILKIIDLNPDNEFYDFKALEVSRRDFLKFSRSVFNKA